MTTGGEGGMVTTNNSELWSLMWSYKDHGKDWLLYTNDSTHRDFDGYMKVSNQLRMTEMQAVIGESN